jgi:hypothetical protein
MTAPIPKTTGEEIGEGINALILGSDEFLRLDDPRVVALWDAATKLQKADARMSFSLRGTLAAICGRIGETHEYFGKALLHPDLESTRMEYWTALCNLGLYSAASEHGTWLLEPKRHFFPTIWERAASQGHVTEVFTRLADAKQGFSDLSNSDFAWLEKAAAVVRESGTSDKQIFAVLDLMGEIQRSHGIVFAGPVATHTRVMSPPDDPAYLHLSMPVAVNAGKLREMNSELSKLVVKRLPNGMFPPGIVASFHRAAPAELQAAA